MSKRARVEESEASSVPRSLFNRVMQIMKPRYSNDENTNVLIEKPRCLLVPAVPSMDPNTGEASFSRLTNFASCELGAHVVFATDEFNCSAANILKQNPPGFHGSEISVQRHNSDIWVTRRRRRIGNDWCIIKLPCPIIVRGIKVSTKGCKYPPPQISVEGGMDIQDVNAQLKTQLEGAFPGYIHRAADRSIFSKGSVGLPIDVERMAANILDATTVWRDILPITRIKADMDNYYEMLAPPDATSAELKVDIIRLNLMPDGCLSNLSIYGETPLDSTAVFRLKEALVETRTINYAAAELGAQIVFSSNGDASALLKERVPQDIDDVWITERQKLRGPMVLDSGVNDKAEFRGDEKAVIALAHRCRVQRIEIWTNSIFADLPNSVEISVIDCTQLRKLPMLTQHHLFNGSICALQWHHLASLEQGTLDGDEQCELRLSMPIEATHILITLIPDGAIARVRVYGSYAKLTNESPYELVHVELDRSPTGNVSSKY